MFDYTQFSIFTLFRPKDPSKAVGLNRKSNNDYLSQPIIRDPSVYGEIKVYIVHVNSYLSIKTNLLCCPFDFFFITSFAIGGETLAEKPPSQYGEYWQPKVSNWPPKNNKWQSKDNTWQAKKNKWPAKDNTWQAKDNTWQAKDNAWQAKDNKWRAKDNMWPAKNNMWPPKDNKWPAKDNMRSAKDNMRSVYVNRRYSLPNGGSSHSVSHSVTSGRKRQKE